MDYDDLDLENIAFEIRKYFQSYKSKQLGRKYKPHPDHDTQDVWLAAAKKCSELNSDPLSFIEGAFRYASVGPYPKHLGSKAVERWCADFARVSGFGEASLTTYESDIKSEIDTASNICYCAFVKRGIPIEESLASNIVRINAYVRIFLMPSSQRVVSQFKEQAAEEINKNPGLYEALKKLGMDLSIIFE